MMVLQSATTTAIFLMMISSSDQSVRAFQALQLSASTRHRRRSFITQKWQSQRTTTTQGVFDDQVVMNVNGDDSSNDDGDTGAGTTSSILLETDAKSRLFESFAALSMADQYDAVLTGLCAKILDSNDAKEATVIAALKEPMDLLNEMNQKRIEASPRSIMALIDVCVTDTLLLCCCFRSKVSSKHPNLIHFFYSFVAFSLSLLKTVYFNLLLSHVFHTVHRQDTRRGHHGSSHVALSSKRRWYYSIWQSTDRSAKLAQQSNRSYHVPGRSIADAARATRQCCGRAHGRTRLGDFQCPDGSRRCWSLSIG